jgi:hypothetical protein
MGDFGSGKTYSRCSSGWRTICDKKVYFRSRWEANIARYLTHKGIEWEFEKDTFWFDNIKRGVRSYTPDFFLPNDGKYIEIKGWWDAKSKTKQKRMKKYHPDIIVEYWDGKIYNEIEKEFKDLIPEWEK